MQCPVCHVSLESDTYKQIAVQKCKSCRGIWFERGDLEQAKDIADPALRWMDFDLWRHTEDFKGARGKHPCPGCQQPMLVLHYGTSGAELELCPSCFGIWLEHARFDRIIEALEVELSDKPISDYLKATLEEARNILTHPTQFMSEWQDFSAILRLLQYRILAARPELHKRLMDVQAENPFK